MQRTANTVYPSRSGATPPASFTTGRAEADYIRTMQHEYKGTFGICVCPAISYEMHQ